MIIETIKINFCLYNVETNEFEEYKDSSVSIDVELVKRCKNGDRRAFNELMVKYQKRIFNIMYRYCGNYDDARDLTQDVFIKVYKSLKSLNDEGKFKSWIITVATNTYRNNYKYMKSRGRGRTDSIDCPLETQNGDIKRDLKDSNPGADELIHKDRIQKIVQEKINLLKDDYKEVIILRDIDGLSYEEISSALNISIGTVKSRIFRARDELKGHLSDIIELL